jgi:Zn-dependent peptidase ImmA (M78 family)
MAPKGTDRRYWTNSSVLKFAQGREPIEAVSAAAQELVLDAIENGWGGPPFDPLELAALRGVRTVPRQDLHDARLVVDESGPRIDFNPTRPRGRLRFSVAHELAHTLFPDFGEFVRHRSGPRSLPDEWQLELLCDVAAAEMLMPVGSFPDLEQEQLQIASLMEYRQRYDVSTEALLLRAIKLAGRAAAVFAASRVDGNDLASPFRIDYVISSPVRWHPPLRRGANLPPASVLGDCTAVGFTARRDMPVEEGAGRVEIQCVGVPPFPGQRLPRVVGLLVPVVANAVRPTLTEVIGDATTPQGEGRKLIVHLVNDATPNWGGEFASALRRRYPEAQHSFRAWVQEDRSNLSLGRVHVVDLPPDIAVATMIAQRGWRPSVRPRIRYVALREGLQTVAKIATERDATVHLPRIGTGGAGGRWEIVAELIDQVLVARGIRVTVYDPPGKPRPGKDPQLSLLS